MAHNCNKQNLLPPFEKGSERAREAGRKGGIAFQQKRKARKTLAAALREVLYEPLTEGSELSKLDGISIKAIKRLYDNPNMRDLRALAELLGELKLNIDTEGLQLNITTSDEGKGNIEKILNGE